MRGWTYLHSWREHRSPVEFPPNLTPNASCETVQDLEQAPRPAGTLCWSPPGWTTRSSGSGWPGARSWSVQSRHAESPASAAACVLREIGDAPSPSSRTVKKRVTSLKRLPDGGTPLRPTRGSPPVSQLPAWRQLPWTVALLLGTQARRRNCLPLWQGTLNQRCVLRLRPSLRRTRSFRHARGRPGALCPLPRRDERPRLRGNSPAIGHRPEAVVRTGVALNGKCPPDVADALARDRRSEVRARAARGRRMTPERLRLLSVDPSVAVRRSVARNRSTPAEALRKLASDPDFKVRERVRRNRAVTGCVDIGALQSR